MKEDPATDIRTEGTDDGREEEEEEEVGTGSEANAVPEEGAHNGDAPKVESPRERTEGEKEGDGNEIGSVA